MAARVILGNRLAARPRADCLAAIRDLVARGPVTLAKLERVLAPAELAALRQPSGVGRLRSVEALVYEAVLGVYRPFAAQSETARRLTARDRLDERRAPPPAPMKQYAYCLNDPRRARPARDDGPWAHAADPEGDPPEIPHKAPAPGDRYCRACHQAWEHVGPTGVAAFARTRAGEATGAS